MTKQATTSTLQTLLSLFEKKQRESMQASACFDAFPAQDGIAFRAVSNSNSDSVQHGDSVRAKSRVCRKGAKAETYS